MGEYIKQDAVEGKLINPKGVMLMILLNSNFNGKTFMAKKILSRMLKTKMACIMNLETNREECEQFIDDCFASGRVTNQNIIDLIEEVAGTK